MEIYSHDDIAAIEGGNWWYASRRRVLHGLLSRFAPQHFGTVLDLGCGVGSNHSLLRPYARELIGLDISPEALSHAKEHGYDRLLVASTESSLLENDSVDLILCADVLEHVDDEAALREIRRILKPGGLLILTVPAFPSLWNENDDYGQHLRRYRPKDLQKLFSQHGFNIKYQNFWNLTFFLPTWIAARLYTKKESGETLHNNLSRIPRSMDTVIGWWMAIENGIGSHLPLPFGVSIALVAQKNIQK